MDVRPGNPPDLVTSPKSALGMVGASAALEGVFRWVTRAALLKSPVVIEGEPGVGKTLAARALHTLSPRRLTALVELDAKDLTTETLMKVLERSGKEAHAGTVVLRRVENLDPRVQPALVRLLKEREAGDGRGPRVVATAFRSLQQGVKEGSFREDLYFRLSVLLLLIPPLRERKEDIPALVRLGLGADEQGRARALSLAAMERALAYPWPGNVRELLEAMAEVRARTKATEAGVEHLPEMLARGPAPSSAELVLNPPPTLMARGLLPAQEGKGASTVAPVREAVFPVSEHLPFKEAKAQLLVAFEREYLARLLKRCGGSIVKTAQQSGLHRKSIERLVKKYGLRERRRRAGSD